MANYLITGGAGFLGSHLCKRLLDESDDINVIVVDNLSSSTGDNLPHLRGNYSDRFTFIQGDICDEKLWKKLDKKFLIDGIFNLACPASPPFYQKMPIETTLACVVGVKHALEYATKWRCKILQTSTSEVYGDPEISPQPETYRGKVNCFGPRACYDEGKRTAEALFYDYQQLHGTDIRIVRIFNTYGPNMLADDGRVVSNFINQALNGVDLTIYGDGSQTRSFCYANDLIDALMVVWNSDYKKPVNIGNPTEFTMLELAKKVIEITNTDSGIKFLPLPKDDPMQRRPDITLIKSLGWGGPKVSLDKGIRFTVQYFRDWNIAKDFNFIKPKELLSVVGFNGTRAEDFKGKL
jgi:UDP-glucuronate decarboxylase